jgi:hypothetical protein
MTCPSLSSPLFLYFNLSPPSSLTHLLLPTLCLSLPPSLPPSLIPNTSLSSLVSQISQFHPPSFKEYPNIKGFMKRFEALPNVAAYKASNQYLHTPFHK